MKTDIRTILILGSEGFLGKNLSHLLTKNNFDVIGIDIQKKDNTNQYKHFIQKNILDITKEDLSEVLSDRKYGLINTGGVSRNGAAKNDPVNTAANTITSYISFLETLNNFPPDWHILTSTREVNILLDSKQQILTGKQKLYPIYKFTTELISESYCEQWNIPLIIVRLSDIFGKGDHQSKVLQIFIQQAQMHNDINVLEPDAKLYLTEVSEVSETILNHISILNKPCSDNQNKLIELWDRSYHFTLLELAYLIKELLPQSKSKLLTPDNTTIEYSICTKLKQEHTETLKEIINNF